jgi:regulator of protease activity HflC (stomatin/prohibitin superfamily)
MIAEQAKLKADYENEKKVAQAEAEATAKLKAAEAEIEIAKAEAEALKIAAEAEAEANRTIAESLTGTILEKIYADKWNGELPDVIGSGDYILPGEIIN